VYLVESSFAEVNALNGGNVTLAGTEIVKEIDNHAESPLVYINKIRQLLSLLEMLNIRQRKMEY
jgi:hypothetical protein